MSHMVTIDKESKRAVEKAGTSVAAQVEGRYGPANAAVAAEASANKEAQNAFSNAKKETKTIVLGGIPPASPHCII